MKFSSVIFDMDGVLIDSTPCHRLAFEKTLVPYGDLKWSYEKIAGMHTKTAFEKIFRENKVKVSPKELEKRIQEKRKLAYELLTVQKPIDPESFAVTAALSKKYPLALASSASRRLVDWFCDASGSRSHFQVILSGEDVDEAKPSPEIYLLAAERLKIVPARCLVIEDAESGIDAAHAAGMPVFMKLGTLSEPGGQSHQVSHCFKNLNELLKLL